MRRPFSRRDLLRTAILAPLAVDVFRSRASALPPIRRVGGAYLKPALNVFSFSDSLNANLKDPKTGIDLFGVCDFCAKSNIDAVDLTGYFFPGYPKAPDDRYINRIKRHAHHLG